jgi:hypothetical protein
MNGIASLVTAKNQMDIELEMGARYLNWKLNHVASLKLFILLFMAIDFLPRWGKSKIKIRKYPKPPATFRVFYPNFRNRKSFWFMDN